MYTQIVTNYLFDNQIEAVERLFDESESISDLASILESFFEELMNDDKDLDDFEPISIRWFSISRSIYEHFTIQSESLEELYMTNFYR